jgi:hypothetical protein
MKALIFSAPSNGIKTKASRVPESWFGRRFPHNIYRKKKDNHYEKGSTLWTKTREKQTGYRDLGSDGDFPAMYNGTVDIHYNRQ